MKYYSYVEPTSEDDMTANKVVLSEQEILEQYWDYWTGRMKEVGRGHLINKQSCIDDFCTIHWAIEEPVFRFADGRYRDKLFVIDHVHDLDPTGEYCMMACLDPSVEVKEYVYLSKLERVYE